MKKIVLIVIILAGFVISSCLEAPFINSSNGTLVLNISLNSNNYRFSTIIPVLDIDHYVIDFTTFNGAATEKEDVFIDVETSTIALSPGMWGIIIYAENSERTRLAEVELTDIEIVKSEKNTINAVLLPVSGNGAISISIDLSSKPDDVTISSITYFLEKGITSPVSVSIGTLSEPYIVSLNCASGSDYRLSFEITTDSNTIISEGIVHVYAGVTTTDTVAISAEDFGNENINIAPPVTIERLVFIHHSCGNNWLNADDGNLGDTLGENNYYVRDTYYGWDALYNDDIGSYTDTAHWYFWFADTSTEAMTSPFSLGSQDNGIPRRDNIMNSLYITPNQNALYTPIADPGGENNIIMFKSCYPLSEVGDEIDDEQQIYIEILEYFALHQDKLFILITPPGETVVSNYENTKELCQWLVDEDTGWLSSYPYANVGVFDFYCVLSETGSHHTIDNGAIVYEYAADYDGISPYHNGDDHPDSAGNQKSTDEFIPLLNYYYNRWKIN